MKMLKKERNSVTKNLAIIFAGGVGSRMGEPSLPKQFIEVYDKPVLIWTLECFEQHPQIDEIYLACKEEWIDHTKTLLVEFNINKVKTIVPGGETAQHSIYNALIEARGNNTEDAIVLIHDGVRPLITEKLITNLIEMTKAAGNAITCTPCHETIIVNDDEDTVSNVPIRRHTFAAQAPQAFFLGDIINAHDEMRRNNPDYRDVVDACTLYHLLGQKINMVTGNLDNIKVTMPEDVFIFKALLKHRASKETLSSSH